MRILTLFLCLAVAGCSAGPSPTPTSTPAQTPGPLAGDPTVSGHEPGNAGGSAWPPLTSEAIASCPVTHPNGLSPEDSRGFNLGNENETLFTIPWPGGAVIFTPNGPGSQEADGSLGMKWPWYRTVGGEVIITARRLEADSPAPEPVVLRGPEDGYGVTGFHPSGLFFTSEGCWEVTASVAGESLTFVTLVVRLPFDLPSFSWWPHELERGAQVDLSGYPTAAREIATGAAGGLLVVETVQGKVDVRAPEGSVEEVSLQTLHDGPALCLRGAAGAGGWNPSADQVSLQWPLEGISYRLIAQGMGFGCEDLLRLANSQQ